MNYIDATWLGLVEGLTEFLPISSTAHLVLASKLLGVEQTEFAKSFEIGIQSGAILAVASLYAKRVWNNWKLVEKIWWAFLPTGLIGGIGYKFIKNILLGNIGVTLAAMFLGGVFILWWERKEKNSNKKTLTIEQLDKWSCIKIGLIQSLAMIPGVSRAAAAIFGGMAMKLSRKEAVELSFLLAAPTLISAAGWDMLKSGGRLGDGGSWGIFLWGVGVSWVVAMIVVKWLVRYVEKRDMQIFGWYRIALVIVWLVVNGQ